MNKITLKMVTRTQGNNRALKAGEITMPDFCCAFEEVNPLPRAFRKMVREQAYDVSEMALTTYITARAYGVPITALPIFLVRDFHHKAIVTSKKSAVTSAKALEGQNVGVSRGYTVTTGVWARSILAEEHGVDLLLLGIGNRNQGSPIPIEDADGVRTLMRSNTARLPPLWGWLQATRHAR